MITERRDDGWWLGELGGKMGSINTFGKSAGALKPDPRSSVGDSAFAKEDFSE